ncbi:MAG: cyclic nucleotide-binding domain-containing protein, partial [Bacteroidota bacterium]
MDLVKELQKVPAFSEIPTEDLAWMAERGEVHSFEEGEVFFSRGDVVEHLNILLEGEIEIRLPQKDGVMPLGSLKKGSITGKLPFSRMQSATAGGVIIKSASVFSLHESYFSELIKTSEPITRVLVWEMTDRARDFTIRQRQHEKLLALGKLSAGLSHELNNPASAVLRSAETLKKHLGQTPERFKRVTGIRLTEEQIDAVNQAIFSCAAEGVKHLSLMERTQLEDDLLDWLEDHGVEEPDEIAENL